MPGKEIGVDVVDIGSHGRYQSLENLMDRLAKAKWWGWLGPQDTMLELAGWLCSILLRRPQFYHP